jgi:hypothetical protein
MVARAAEADGGLGAPVVLVGPAVVIGAPDPLVGGALVGSAVGGGTVRGLVGAGVTASAVVGGTVGGLVGELVGPAVGGGVLVAGLVVAAREHASPQLATLAWSAALAQGARH